MKENVISKKLDLDITKLAPHFPIQALRLLNAYEFTLKIVGMTKDQKEVYKKSFESDSFGNFNFKIPLTEERKQIEILQLYEVRKRPGLELQLGTYIPLRVYAPKKIVICDFDKTLVDTKYSTTKEVYRSLTKPLEDFPTVISSVNILKRSIHQGYHPFILSASPHFYEDAMRDWLYKNNIFSAGIFLKDYRHVFSFLEGDLMTKDIKGQGLYKLNHLLDILLMTGVPDELILMGDNFESDPVIYLTMATILTMQIDPWIIWNSIKSDNVFKLKRKQNSQLLNKIFQLDNLLARRKKDKTKNKMQIKIYIRKKNSEDLLDLPLSLQRQLKLVNLIEMYDGVYQDNSVKGAESRI